MEPSPATAADNGRDQKNEPPRRQRRQGKAVQGRAPSAELERVAHAVIGAAIEVHRYLGPGFLEAVYEQAMEIELQARAINVRRQVVLTLDYKGQRLPSAQLDLLVEDQLVVELKAVEALRPLHTAQLISYLKAGAFQLGLLINFNVPVLRQGIRRVIWND